MSMVGRLTTSARVEQLMFNRMKFSSSVSAAARTCRQVADLSQCLPSTW